MTTARKIRAKLREQEQAKLKLRESALMAVVTAGEVVAREQEAVEGRKARLREQLERDLAAEDAKVTAVTAAAGQAVLAALGGELAEAGAAFRESQLHDLTGFAVAEMRRWVRAARQSVEPDEVSPGSAAQPVEREGGAVGEVATSPEPGADGAAAGRAVPGTRSPAGAAESPAVGASRAG